MAAIWMRVGAQMRRTWRAWTVMAVLLGIASGAAMAAAAGARRTESAYPRFLEHQHAIDVLADARDVTGNPTDLGQVKALESVDDATAVLGLFNSDLSTATGRRLTFPDVIPIVSEDGRFGSELNVSKILDGRWLDQTRVDEAVVGFTVAAEHGIAVGDELDLRLFELVDFAPTGEILGEERIRVVGIGIMPGEFQALSGASIPSIHLTRTLYERYADDLPPNEVFAIDLAAGATPEDLDREGNEVGLTTQAFFQQDRQTASVRRSNRYQAVSLWLLAAVLSLAIVAILGQAMVRQTALEGVEQRELRALGMTSGQTIAAGVIRSLFIAAAATVVAWIVAIATSPLTPTGLARVAEPTPGVWVDLVALGIGSAAIVVLVVVPSAVAQRFGARRSTSAPSIVRIRPSRLARVLARLGAPTPAVAGTRLALETGHGKQVPVRGALIGVGLSATAVTAALVLGANMERLVTTPALVGWTFDLVAGGPPEAVAAFEDELRDEGMLVERGHGTLPTFLVEDGAMIDAGLVLPEPFVPAIAEGAAPVGADQIALGRDTMAARGLSIGDRATVSLVTYPPEGDFDDAQALISAPVTAEIVGRLVQPPLGFNLGGAGEGIAMSGELLQRIIDREDDPRHERNLGLASYIRTREGTDLRDLIDRISVEHPDVFFTYPRLGQTASADAGRLTGVPAILAGLLALLGLATLVHALLTSIRRRARELAVLRTLGFIRRQVHATVAWQATTIMTIALLVGLPFGVIAGRVGWRAFADTLGVVPTVTTPLLGIAITIPVFVVAANAIAALPARAASRTGPAALLRNE